MPIPRRSFKISLEKATPGVLTPESLQKQLNDVGLDCADTSKPRLERFIREVEEKLPNGLIQTYGILQPVNDPSKRLQGAAFAELAGDYEKVADGNWTVKDFGYAADLELIQLKVHFDWLEANKVGFGGRRNDDRYVRRYESVASIEDFFYKITNDTSATVVKGINKDSLSAALNGALAPLDDEKAKDYDKTGSRVMFLVDNYNPDKEDADGIGVVTVEWRLIIKDYKVKKEALKHDTVLEVHVRAVTYDSLSTLEEDVKLIRANFGANADLALRGIPPKDNSLVIYDREPSANADTFQHALPIASETTYLDRLVLFAPDLQLVGSIDNTNSTVATTYAKSVTTGFTFSSTQTLGIKVSAEAGVVFAKASFEISFSISFTEQYSKSSTETVTFSVPEGDKAFLYQGTLRSRVLRYDPAKDMYFYHKEEASFLTTIFETFKAPIPNKKPTVLRQLSD